MTCLATHVFSFSFVDGFLSFSWARVCGADTGLGVKQSAAQWPAFHIGNTLPDSGGASPPSLLFNDELVDLI